MATTNYKFNEDEKNYTLSLDLPGYNKEDITINAEARSISVKAKRENVNGKYILKERSNIFDRKFNLYMPVDKDNVTANYEKGVLNITLPKHNTSRQISLN